MSKWADKFISDYKEVGTVRELTKEIKDAVRKREQQKLVDKNITRVCKGEVKRRLFIKG